MREMTARPDRDATLARLLAIDAVADGVKTAKVTNCKFMIPERMFAE
jgi:hypothetical protein